MAEKVPGEVCRECKWPDSDQPEAPHHLPPRTILNNVYLTGRVLSEDEFGIIYLAMEMSSREKLIIKEFFPRAFVTRHHNTIQVLESNETLQDFYNFGLGQFIEEGMALLNSRDVAGLQRTHDLFRLNGTAYQVMDHIEGISLETTLNLLGKVLSFQNVLKIIFPIMNALEHLHNTGLLHYDIHPGNIIVTGDGGGVLVNFSASNFAIAQRENNLSSILRPGYSPPELYIKDDAFSPQSDIYSLAASIHRAICGSSPPNALSRLENDTIKMPARLNPTVSEKGQSSLMKGLAVRPAARYQNIVDFRREILSGMKVKEPKGKPAVKQPKNAQDAFSAITCPVCATRNEVLKNDLKLGTSQCRACSHPFILDDRDNLTTPSTFKPVANKTSAVAPHAPAKKEPGHAYSFTIVKCEKCKIDNEVLLNDLQAGALCFNCATVLTEEIEHVASADNGKIRKAVAEAAAAKKTKQQTPLPKKTAKPKSVPKQTVSTVEAPVKPVEKPPAVETPPSEKVHTNGTHKPKADRPATAKPKRVRRPRIPFSPPPPVADERKGGFLDDTGEFEHGEDGALSSTEAKLTCPSCSTVNLVPVASLANGASCENCGAVLLHIAEDALDKADAEKSTKTKTPILDEVKPPEFEIDDAEEDLPPFDASLYDIRPEEPTQEFDNLDLDNSILIEPDEDASIIIEPDEDASILIDPETSIFDGEELLLKPEAPTQEFPTFDEQLSEQQDNDVSIFDGENLLIEPEAPTKDFDKAPIQNDDQLLSDDSRYSGEESTLFHLNDEAKKDALEVKPNSMLPGEEDKSLIDKSGFSGDPSLLDVKSHTFHDDIVPQDPSILDIDSKTVHDEPDEGRITEADLFPVLDQSEPEELEESSLKVITCRRCGRKNSYHPENVKDGLRCRYCKRSFEADQTDTGLNLSVEQKNELLNLSDSKEVDEEQSVTVVACPKCKTRNFVQASTILEGGECSRCGHSFLSEPIQSPTPAEVEADPSFEEEIPYDIGNEGRKKLLFVGSILAVLLVALGSVFYWAMSNQSRQDKLTEYLTAARVASSQGKHSVAIENLEGALIIRPEDRNILQKLERSKQQLEQQQQLKLEEKRQQTFLEDERVAADSLFAAKSYEDSQSAYEFLLDAQPEDTFIVERLNIIAEKLKQPKPRRARQTTARSSNSTPVTQRLRIRSGGDLQSYVRRAKPNSLITLASGIYTLSSPLIIDKSISIEGEGMNKSLIVSSVTGNSIEIRNGAVFKANMIGMELQSGQQGNLIYVDNGEIDVRKSSLKGALKPGSDGNSGCAVWFAKRSRGKLHTNQFSSNNIAVRISGSADPVISSNDMLNNKVAIEIGESAKSMIRGNRIKSNKLDGIQIIGSANPLIDGNTITENKRNGVWLEMEKSGGTLRNNQILYSGEVGILLTGAAKPSIEKNKVRFNTRGGLHYRENSGGSCQNNEIKENKYGIKIANNATPRIWENQISQNKGDGIEIVNKAKPTINKNMISSNDADGISLVLDQNGGVITNNQSLRNRGYGISFLNDFRPTNLLNNITTGNYEGDIYEDEESL
ncbi:MAG: right-handed parallel beta-helix repeat-containing protein [Calditrichia bacterium]